MLDRNRRFQKGEADQIDLIDRVKIEAEITDHRAREVDIQSYQDLSYDSYVKSIEWRRFLFDFLGDLKEKRVLNICCGYSMTPVIFALAGAEVTAVDVSSESLKKVKEVAEMHLVADRVTLHCGPVESLPFPDHTFDILYGGAALHHLLLDKAGPELFRVLVPGGRGGFQDPLGHNRLLEFARDNLSYQGKNPDKGTDKPMQIIDVTQFGQYFSHYTWRSYGLLIAVIRVIPFLKRFRFVFETLDRFLFAVMPFTQRYSQYVIICVQK